MLYLLARTGQTCAARIQEPTCRRRGPLGGTDWTRNNRMGSANREPVAIPSNAARHPRVQVFRNLPEDHFEAILCVPPLCAQDRWRDHTVKSNCWNIYGAILLDEMKRTNQDFHHLLTEVSNL